MSAETHPHAHHAAARLSLAFWLTVVILVVEVAAGYASHSLALLSDAGHILTDLFALAVAWFAFEQAKRPADSRRTYGYHRVGILAAMVNGAVLTAIVGGIAYEALQRLLHPEPVQGGLVIIAALVVLAVNSFIALSLRRAGAADLNVRAALLHVLGDVAASVGLVVSGGIILLTGWLYADPLLSLAIGALIAWGALKIVLDAVNVLLEGMPRGLELASVEHEIQSTPGVHSVHDLHVWSLASHQLALSCHVVVAEDRSAADGEHLIRDLEQRLCQRFQIGHTTIQLEVCHPCEDDAIHGAGVHNHPHSAPAGSAG